MIKFNNHKDCCGNKIDLKTYIAINSFVSHMPIKCSKCKCEIYYKNI